jgi:hypothetical protein
MLQTGYMKIIAYLMFLATTVPSVSAGRDPYSTLTADQKVLMEPVVERYIRDQIKQDWADLWEIQDQTSDLKNELLLGRRDAPDLNKEQFVSTMRDTIGIGYPRLRSFELREVKPDTGNFILIGCGEATRESWKQTGFVIAGIRIVDGKPKVDLWSMTSDSCS